MKLIALAALASVALAAPLYAQSQADTSRPAATDSAKFYRMDETPIPGQTKRPGILVFDPRPRAKFDFLLKLKKSMRPAMAQSAGDRSLR